MLREEQIDIRRQRAKASKFQIENLTKKKVFSEYRVTNPESKGQYTVTVHGFDVGDNSCTCPDFKSNTLGTCKHIEAVLEDLKDDLPAHLQKKKAIFTRPEVYLNYGDPLRVGIHLPSRHSDKLAQLAKRFFDEKGLWHGKGRFEDLIPEIQRVPEEVTVLSDAMEHIEREVERDEMLRKEREWLEELSEGRFEKELLNVPLYDYQLRGAIFLACRARSILGDDMGLGKTVQTLAAVEILIRERNISRVLVIAPSSVKYQWATEIQKFTPRAVQIIDGSPEVRQAQYLEPTFYRLVNYEQVVRDRESINAWKPDVIVLDEAQRIKNWESKTSREVKKLKSRYAMVLSGTPLENRLEELYSIVQFVDERRFGPAFQFLSDHRILDADGNLKGYRNLDTIREKLEPILLRRTRAEVLTQLPERTDNTIYVELMDEQRGPYDEQKTTLARLMQKGYLTDLDRKRILACIVNMRMVCNSTFLVDKTTHISPKLTEFTELASELLEDEAAHKLVVFSQWETMVQEAAKVLEKLRVGHVVLHGGLPGKERQFVLKKFQNDPGCRVFLSTDAGGTGLNLQIADTVVNLELPWNPAVLEQRIARVHRMGQSRPVRVINLVTRGTIEERVMKTLEQKQSLFAGLFDSEDEELVFTNVGSGTLLKAVRELLTDAKPVKEPTAVVTPTIGGEEIWRAAAAFLDSLAVAKIEPPEEIREQLRTSLEKLRGKLQ